jgi:hypothetical protein
MSDEERSSRLTREALAAADWEKMFIDPAFRRIVYTILETAGMFTGNFHSDGRIHAAREGRRSLGLDILRTAETYLGPEALPLILSEEMKTLKEAPHANRQRNRDYADRRRTELGPVDVDLREPGTGLSYLDYGSDGEGG